MERYIQGTTYASQGFHNPRSASTCKSSRIIFEVTFKYSPFVWV